jgi:hypothetical protein
MTKLQQYATNVYNASKNFALAFVGKYVPRPAKNYGFNLAVALDEFGNAITGGDPGETISSRSAKARNDGRVWGCILCKFLNWFQKNHCDLALDPNAGAEAVIPDGD